VAAGAEHPSCGRAIRHSHVLVDQGKAAPFVEWLLGGLWRRRGTLGGDLRLIGGVRGSRWAACSPADAPDGSAAGPIGATRGPGGLRIRALA